MLILADSAKKGGKKEKVAKMVNLEAPDEEIIGGKSDFLLFVNKKRQYIMDLNLRVWVKNLKFHSTKRME